MPLFIAAERLYRGTEKALEYQKIAEKAGDCIWKFGLLKKGISLCHGISGNAYSLMQLYNAYGVEAWKKKAQTFLLATINETITKEQKSCS